MPSIRAAHNLLAVSANSKETGLNTAQTLDTSLLVSASDIMDLERRRENNSEEMNGKEEPTLIYDLGATSKLGLTFEKAQAQHCGFVMGYGLGSVATVASGNGYVHTITPISGDLSTSRSNPTFTAGQRLGQTVGKRLCIGMAIDSLTATFAKDQWVKLAAQAKGTGKFEDTVSEIEISALDNATSLTLTTAVQGATAAERLDSVQRIRAETSSGTWREVTFTAVSAATPAVVSINSLGLAGATINYRILYTPTEPAWGTFPARVLESPLRISGCTITFGGKWDGSLFRQGRAMTSEIESVEWSLQNNLALEFVPGASGAYASRSFRDGRLQTIKLNRELRNWIMQQHIAANDTTGLYITCTGDEFATGESYLVTLMFPKLGVLNSPISVNGKRLAEAGDLQVLEDDTYGSVIATVTNQVATYAA